jgi:hypothetical protein
VNAEFFVLKGLYRRWDMVPSFLTSAKGEGLEVSFEASASLPWGKVPPVPIG